MPKIRDIERWRVELQLSERYRQDNFGEYTNKKHSFAGINIDYFEKGFSYVRSVVDDVEILATLNIIHMIVKNIVPSINYQNPKVLAMPNKMENEDVAPIVTQTINHYYEELEVEEVNKQVVWDAYVLGHGLSKIGYATKFGMDIEDKEAQKKKDRGIVDRTLEALNLKKKPEDEVRYPEINMNIESESPYVIYVSPFRFLRDIRVNNLNESMWVAEEFTKTVKEMKANPKYKNTKGLEGSIPDVEDVSFMGVSETEIEAYKFVNLYEIHYRQPEGVYILVITKDGNTFREHYHELSPYEIDGWQYEELNLNKHSHKMYSISDITKIRPLQDRFTSTMDAILEQVDRFVPKLAVNSSELTEEGKNNLKNTDVGAIIECTKNPNEVFRELQMTQLKGDLRALLELFIELVSMLTGLTKSQILGVASAETATSEQIAQSGLSLRLSDMNEQFNNYSKRQATKLWQVIRQFVDLQELNLINGVSGVDQETGTVKYDWLEVSEEQSEKMQTGGYSFRIEPGSSQKPDLSIIRKQFENLFSILARTDVITIMQQQGSKIDLSELLRMYLQLFPEAVKNIGKIIQRITPETQGLIPPEVPGPGGMTSGSQANAIQAQAAAPVPTAQTVGSM